VANPASVSGATTRSTRLVDEHGAATPAVAHGSETTSGVSLALQQSAEPSITVSDPTAPQNVATAKSITRRLATVAVTGLVATTILILTRTG
jgi:hypothetical protein